MSRGFQPKKRRQHAADGGLIRGPGTTTSDDIKTHMRPGSYILPADTTETLSANNLTRDGRLAPVAVSDGEFQLTPEQVQAVGEQVLDAVRNVTHEPVVGEGLGFGPRQHLADGGVVDEEALRRRRFYVDANGQVRPVAPGQQTGMVPAGPRTTGGMPAPAPQFNATVTNPALATGTVTPQPAGFRPLPGSVGGDYAARANAMHNRMRDTANYNAQRAAQDGKFAEAVEAQRAAQQKAATKPSVGSRGRGLVNRLGPLGAATLAAPAIEAAREPDSTARYAERFGFDEPTGDGSIGDIVKFAALRGLGFASDVGSTLTGGLADTLYRDKQQINTDAIPDAGAAATGGFVGRGAGKWTGKALDKAGNIVTRGRYDGDTAEKVLSNTGLIGGAIGGVALANADGTPVVTDPTQQAIYDDGYLPEPENDGSEANNITRVGNSFSGTNIGPGFTVNGRPSSEADPLMYHADNPAEAAASNWRAKLNLFERTPGWAGGNTGVPAAGNAGNAPMPFGFRPGANTGGGPRATLIRNSGTPSNAEILRERMRGQRDQIAQRGRQIDADTNLRQQQIDIQGRTADAQLMAQQAERALAMRTAARMEALRDRYDNAKTQEERASIALAIRDLLGQARPQYQIARSDRLATPDDPLSQKISESFIIDPATGEARPVQAGGAWPKPTAANINALRKGMATKEQFEERFGPGSANIYGA